MLGNMPHMTKLYDRLLDLNRSVQKCQPRV